MNTAERIELLENRLYVAYKTYFETFGSIPVPASFESDQIWAELTMLYAEVD